MADAGLISTPAAEAPSRLDRYADVITRVGANVDEGQVLQVHADVVHAPLVRAIARSAYRAGAAHVDVLYSDTELRRAQVELAAEANLQATPGWMVERIREAEAGHVAIVFLGGGDPLALSDLPAARLAAARMPGVIEAQRWMLHSGSCNWVSVCGASTGWAKTLFGEPDVERLWTLLERVMRLDAADPVAAWSQRIAEIQARARLLNERDFAALRYRGPGTELRVGLGVGRWTGAGYTTSWGRRHMPNLPTEEVFTTPDARTAEGHVTTTRPLPLAGAVIEELRLDFSGGRVTRATARSGEEMIRAELERDEGARRLGELALVDGSSRVGQLGLTFYQPLLDENCTCHVALGAAIPAATREGVKDGVNDSLIHVDFMIGGPEVDVFGVERGGGEVPVLRGEEWLL